MEFFLGCASCIVRQVAQVASLLQLEKSKSETLLRKVLSYVSQADYTKSTPQLMGEIWDLLEAETGTRDVYKTLKLRYDNAVLAQTGTIRAVISREQTAAQQFEKALFFAVYGNMIDLAAAESFDEAAFFENAEKASHIPFSIDNRPQLYAQLKAASESHSPHGEKAALLYIGDNSGEIALDKLFIQIITEQFPGIGVTYAVRGQAVLNDVTLLDAEAVGMSSAAAVVSNGSKAAGTVLSDVSQEFLQLFADADIVIAKGQGNFESLHPCSKKNLFYLLMAKCPSVASAFQVAPMTIVCKQNGV